MTKDEWIRYKRLFIRLMIWSCIKVKLLESTDKTVHMCFSNMKYELNNVTNWYHHFKLQKSTIKETRYGIW